MSGWVRVEDRLPGRGQPVIYFFECVGVWRGHFEMVTFDGDPERIEYPCFVSEGGFLIGDVTHWMPDRPGDLPIAPKLDSNSD